MSDFPDMIALGPCCFALRNGSRVGFRVAVLSIFDQSAFLLPEQPEPEYQSRCIFGSIVF